MAHIYLCFVWHMHQPFYRDLLSGEYRLPWTRMHALKDYYGMVRVLEEFPEVHQTFNLVPSMMLQVQEYASGQAVDPFLRCALKPAEELSLEEQDFILKYFFQANVQRLIRRYPRYGELYDAWEAGGGASGRDARRVRQFFGIQAYRDLQVLSQLAWFDEEFLEGDPEVRALVGKGRDFTLEDQALAGRKQLEILRKVLPAYAEAAARGQIEISTTPFYHPILPLLCDSDIARVSHPNVPLPPRFRYPQDARRQLEDARSFVTRVFGVAPVGLWPSEGSVSNEVFRIASEAGYGWAATDNGVLARTLGTAAEVSATYRPYLWRQDGRQMHVLFRDHYLSDLIGFVYARMSAAEAAADFLGRVRENCREILAAGRDAVVPVILDGENAWEYYERNGRPFLRELYRRITLDPKLSAVTVREALEKVPSQTIDHIFPGSWINANFDIWIGADEDNRAWECLLAARQAYDRAVNGPAGAQLAEEDKRLAFEELMIAEGSDWCWWYGPEHGSANRPEFDRLFREHVANVYRALKESPPEELSRPILRAGPAEYTQEPAGPVRPVIDGEITSYFEWLGAGLCRVDARSGAMHGQRFLIRELHYGSDGENLYLRLDLEQDEARPLEGSEVRLNLGPLGENAAMSSLTLRLERGSVTPVHVALAASPAAGAGAVECGFRNVLEIRLPLEAAGVAPGQTARLQLSLWQGGLPVDALPQQGWLELPQADPEL